MAKDPAFLFYPGDYLGGTMGMSFEEKGAYVDLLIFQFNNHHFTEAQAKQVLSICFDNVWNALKNKFKKEGEKGEFLYNERLRNEIIKRQAFSESRRINALHAKKPRKKNKSICKASAEHMENENRNINIKESFNLFWKEYPKKKSKKAAEKAFLKIKPNEQLLETIISTIRRAKTSAEWQKDGGQFIPHPATWLNNGGWEDEYSTNINVQHRQYTKPSTGYRGQRQPAELPADVQADIDAINRLQAKKTASGTGKENTG